MKNIMFDERHAESELHVMYSIISKDLEDKEKPPKQGFVVFDMYDF